MLQYSILVVIMFLIDFVIIFMLLKTVRQKYKSNVISDYVVKRSRSKVRQKFRSIQDVKKFYEWRDYIRKSLIEVEIKHHLEDSNNKVYHNL